MLGILQRNIEGTGSANIHVREQDTINLRTRITNTRVGRSLLELTWYHNDSVIIPNHNPRYAISGKNTTLTIINFTSTDAGVYQAQFNLLFIHPYNGDCEDNVLTLYRNHPVLKPAVFCVNMEERCSGLQPRVQMQEISVVSVDQALNGSLNVITLKVTGRVLSNKELQHATIQWYRNGHRVTSGLSTLQKNFNKLGLKQEFQVFDASYEDSGRYEVLLKLDMYTYLRSNCEPYYGFVSQYLGRYLTLAQAYIDIHYYKGTRYSVKIMKILLVQLSFYF